MVTETIGQVNHITTLSHRQTKPPLIIQRRMNVWFKHINTKPSQPSWWESLEHRWKKLTSILTQEKTKSYTLNPTSLQRCGRNRGKRLLYSFNAMCEDGLRENRLTHLGNLGMTGIWNCWKNKMILGHKKKRSTKKKSKEECILRNIKISKSFTTN